MSSYGLVRTTQLKYGNNCTLTWCNLPRKSGHRYCIFHKRKLLHRGDAEQQKINIRDINFARKTVQQLISDNQSNPAWTQLMEAIESNWKTASYQVNEELNRSNDGRAYSKHRRNGLQICYDIFNTLGLEKTFINYCAWFYLSESNPNLFISDIAFRHLLVKTLKNQAQHRSKVAINKLKGKSQIYSYPVYVYERDVVWEVMTGIFGTTGMQLYKQLERRAEGLRLNKEKINDALRRIE